MYLECGDVKCVTRERVRGHTFAMGHWFWNNNRMGFSLSGGNLVKWYFPYLNLTHAILQYKNKRIEVRRIVCAKISKICNQATYIIFTLCVPFGHVRKFPSSPLRVWRILSHVRYWLSRFELYCICLPIMPTALTWLVIWTFIIRLYIFYKSVYLNSKTHQRLYHIVGKPQNFRILFALTRI